MRLAFDFRMLASVVLMLGVVRDVNSVTCYVCESWKNWRCLDPFPLGQFIQVNDSYIYIFFFLLFRFM